jgi:hypothetical protein
MSKVYYPKILVKLYDVDSIHRFNGALLLHSFTCKNIADWKERTCKAFYVSNYKSHNKAKPLYYELDLNINYKKYHVRMEAVNYMKNDNERYENKRNE